MATDFLARCDSIEECYEFMLAYAGQGLPSDEGSPIRQFLQRAAQALTGLCESCSSGLTREETNHSGKFAPFLAVLHRDAQDSLAAIEMVLAEPAISSQLIDNLNASIHLRALLTDLFLIGEILRSRKHKSAGVAE